MIGKITTGMLLLMKSIITTCIKEEDTIHTAQKSRFLSRNIFSRRIIFIGPPPPPPVGEDENE